MQFVQVAHKGKAKFWWTVNKGVIFLLKATLLILKSHLQPALPWSMFYVSRLFILIISFFIHFRDFLSFAVALI
jgi:hypothetical protein